jgi:hypothetical protein
LTNYARKAYLLGVKAVTRSAFRGTPFEIPKKPLTTIGLYDKSDTNVVIPLAMALILGVEGGEK